MNGKRSLPLQTNWGFAENLNWVIEDERSNGNWELGGFASHHPEIQEKLGLGSHPTAFPSENFTIFIPVSIPSHLSGNSGNVPSPELPLLCHKPAAGCCYFYGVILLCPDLFLSMAAGSLKGRIIFVETSTLCSPQMKSFTVTRCYFYLYFILSSWLFRINCLPQPQEKNPSKLMTLLKVHSSQ